MKTLKKFKLIAALIAVVMLLIFASASGQGIKISALPTLTAPDSSADYIPIVHSGTTYKVTPGRLFHEFGYGGGGSTPWYLNGNTVGSEKFIGTLDNYAVPVRVNNAEVWSWETDGSIFRNGNLYSVPYSATFLNTTWGKNAGSSVVAGGGARNIIIGNNTATSLTSGVANIIIGEYGGSWNTGASLISGIENTIIGSGSAGVLTGGRNTIIGYTVGVGLTTGDHNILVGHRIGRGSGGATSGLTTGTYNIVIGTEETAKYLGTGSTNTIVGTSAAQYLENVSNIDAFGNFAALRSSTATITNSTYLGQGTIAQQSAEVVVGGLKRSKFYFGSGKFTGQNTYLVDIYMQPHSPAVGSAFTDGGDFADKTDGNGVNWYFGVSQPTGTGTAGDMIFQYAPTVQSSGTTQNALATGMTFKGSTGQLQFGTIGVLFNPYGTSAGNTGEIRFTELAANGSNYTGFKSPDSRSANLIYTLPSTDPTSGDVLVAGVPSGGVVGLTWATIGGTGTVTSIATTSPITGGTITNSGTIGINNSAADGSTKGAASFTAADFNSSSGLISLDYANGQEATSGQDGFLSSTDWSTFNGKQDAGSYLTADGAITGATAGAQYFQDGIQTSIIDDGSAGEVAVSVGGIFIGGFNTTGVYTDNISENTAAAGVTVDGVLLKDGLVLGQYGGTGVANTGKTITLGGNLTTSGAHATTFTTTGTTGVTLPTTGTLATLAGTETFTNKSIVATQLTGTAYTIAANNTNSTAAYTLEAYENHPLATYGGTIDFNGTDPSTIISQQYRWSKFAGFVTLTLNVLYTTPGVTNTSAIFTLPSDCPAPATIANSGDAASEYMYPICGARVEANQTGNPSAIRGGIRRNSTNNGYEIALIFGSVSALNAAFTIVYPVD